MAAPPLPGEPPRVGFSRVLDKTFTLIRDRFWLVYGVTLVVYVPVFFWNLFMRQFQLSVMQGGSPVFMRPEAMISTIAAALAFLFAWSLVWPFGTMAATAAVARSYLGQGTSVWDSYREVFRLFWQVLGLFLLWGLLVSLGYLMCFVPGIYLALRFYLAFPAFMVERQGVMESLRRSGDLMRGMYWRVILLVLVVGLVKGGLASAVSYSGAAIFSGPGIVHVVLYALAQFAGQLLVAPFDFVLAVVVYFEVREAREGLDLEILSAEVERALAPRSAAPDREP